MNEQLQIIINRLENRTDLQTLSPAEVWRPELDIQIESLDIINKNASKSVIALMAGLHLWNDSLHKSHAFSQRIEDDPTGSYWHAIMHRMEPDYPNSKYWFGKAGNHPVKDTLPGKAADLLKDQDLDSLAASPIVNTLKQFKDQQSWNCDGFVDLVQMQENGKGTEQTREILELLQQLERDELFNFTYEAMLKEVILRG